MENVETYLNAIDEFGLDSAWDIILKSDVPVANYGELYEIGLAHVNKDSKKSLGKYFTPDDVATLMAKLFDKLPGNNVCDVCCGVGNLILAYLKLIGREQARELIKSGRLWLYDKDALALYICVNAIGKIYGDDVVGYVHSRPGDFLDENVNLPVDCKVISNPPYAKVEEIPETWKQTAIVNETHELYAAMMEKILSETGNNGSVILTPQNYLGREKFKTLREKLDTGYSGFIIPFDNTPGQIFNGRKHGVFNSNTQNQVRPAILVTDNRDWGIGLRIAGMVRFRNGERDKVLQPEFLESMVGNIPQRPRGDRYAKCFPQLEETLQRWQKFSENETLKDFIDEDGDYYINFATTCRYFTVGYVSDLYRSGKRTILFKDEETRDLAYCFLNSSFCYWHWRLYDGEITYQKGMLDDMPTFFNKIRGQDRIRLLEIAKEMQQLESSFIVKKKNSGKMMENIKFPEKYRDEINEILLRVLCSDKGKDIFDLVHAHSNFHKGT